MFEKKETSLINLVLLTAIASAFQPCLVFIPPALAQVAASSPTAFPLPTAVPTGTTVRIDGSSSMASANQALKQRFEAQFPGTSVTTGYGGTPTALQAVLDGKADIAAIGRALTPQEKAQGLVAVPLSRDKIAIVVGSNNPFNGSITDQQFAKIFRGEITDWSQVGGSSGKIRVLDRPEISDTRQALSNYPVFKTAPFTSGVTTTRLSEDSTASMISQLGTDGISYTIANQAREASGLKVLPMHNTLPTDPRYPFSQSLVYVYKGTNPSPAIAAFLGYASAPNVQQAIQSAQVDPTLLAAGSVGTAASSLNATPTGATASATTASSDGVASPTASASAVASATVTPTTIAARPAQNDGGISPWLWWLLPLGLLGLFLLWLNSRRETPEEGVGRS
ncbi:MAG: substrate-binding domain-containing protein, partial [Phormidesmis sp. CAN_BIN44]|nr:substrate-binding domain-containing protein [Phormidesmis sp. CAN_BIN44]